MKAAMLSLPAAGGQHSCSGRRAAPSGARPARPAAVLGSSKGKRRDVRVKADAEGSRAGKDDKSAASPGDARPADPLAGFEEFWKTGGFPHYLYSQARGHNAHSASRPSHDRA